MKRLFIAAAVCLSLLGIAQKLQAQQTHIDRLWVDTRGTFHQEWRDGVYGTHFQGDYLNLHMQGQIANGLTFRVRQRLNKQIENNNPFSATDFLWLRWQATPHWAFTAGKHPIMVGGYEIDSAPIDVYYYGAFSNNLYQYYAFGISATWMPAQGQNISFQFCPSPISPVTQNEYSYNLYWNGHIGKHWETTWSYNFVFDEYERLMNWIVLGNKFLMGPLVVDVDYINRASFRQSRYFFSDGSLIGKAILTLGKWNLCTKVGYEWNSEDNADGDGLSYDLTLPAGHTYVYGGAGVEFFPLGNDNLRLHIVYFMDNHDKVHNLDLGVTWRFTIYQRKQAAQ